MDSRRIRRNPSLDSLHWNGDYPSGPSIPDPNQHRPSPLRNNISMSDEEPQGYSSHYATSQPALNTPYSHSSQNPFETPKISPTYSSHEYMEAPGNGYYNSYYNYQPTIDHQEPLSYGEFIDPDSFTLQPFSTSLDLGGSHGNHLGRNSEFTSDLGTGLAGSFRGNQAVSPELIAESNSNTSSRRPKHEFTSYLLSGS
jgi:hypothetical protein